MQLQAIIEQEYRFMHLVNFLIKGNSVFLAILINVRFKGFEDLGQMFSLTEK